MKATDIVLISVGRLDKNKNNATLIKAVSRLNNPLIQLLICGDGAEREALEVLTKELNVTKQIHFLGNRSDMLELYRTADIFVMASYREGLSRSLMEAMASGLPCVVSDIRGNRDLIIDGKNGYLVMSESVNEFADRIKILVNNSALRSLIFIENLKRVKQFDIKEVERIMDKIYREILISYIFE